MKNLSLSGNGQFSQCSLRDTTPSQKLQHYGYQEMRVFIRDLKC